MRREDWNKGLGEIDPELVEEYIEQKAKYAKRTGRMPLVRAIAVAACVCVVVGAVIALPIALRYGSERWLSIPDDTTSENGGALSEETTDTTDTLDPDDMFAQGSSVNIAGTDLLNFSPTTALYLSWVTLINSATASLSIASIYAK